MDNSIPLNRRIEHLKKQLDSHNHDELVKFHGHCTVCSHKLHDGFFRNCKCSLCEPFLGPVNGDKKE